MKAFDAVFDILRKRFCIRIAGSQQQITVVRQHLPCRNKVKDFPAIGRNLVKSVDHQQQAIAVLHTFMYFKEFLEKTSHMRSIDAAL